MEEIRLAELSGEERLRQMEYIAKIRSENDAWEAAGNPKKKYFSFVMGCQMNTHDSEKLVGMLKEMGYAEGDSETDADFIIYNTCCIRENAEQKIYGKLGWLKHYKKINPNAIVAICGCMMQQEGVLQTIRREYRRVVDMVFGTFNIYKLPELLYRRLETGKPVYDIWQDYEEVVEDLPRARTNPFKASVNIMYGCNNFCAYCIVPYVRGRERSREAEAVLAEVKQLAADGVKEITLLGQNVNSYGQTLEHPISFAKLLQMVHEVEGIERIRFTTSNPKDISDELIATMAEYPKICNNLHLPLQAGSDSVLQRMNRKYTKESYLEQVKKLRAAMPDITLTTDIIIGFPGETEEDFQDTIDVVKEAKYSIGYTFMYSKRTGTPAATMDNQVPDEVMRERFERLLGVLNPGIAELHKDFVGREMVVLVEEISKNDPNVVTGRAENNLAVYFEGSSDLIGKMVPVKIVYNKTFYLLAERILGESHGNSI
ncbi:tRNA (N6-isopentenyl adenosine(37)-C2)-methylthiotransferase MiaB [Chakrabartyella piscis]|uniref:tRNA (N6-isopentenyl adenosine(37)-C2)-methylthiotransferase MiaB n=1 Tax=Chakrabartyella piscis TaxID=2918914 RepID=UPI002958A249|nr:tRNA (N6-isopentenyl adenosine(37)-C2)-methylthiotransferase MiaB [Chakrabartyella piscis]